MKLPSSKSIYIVLVVVLGGAAVFAISNSRTVKTITQSTVNVGLINTNEPTLNPNNEVKLGLVLNIADWKNCRDEKKNIEFLYPPTMTCSIASGPDEDGATFDVLGSYAVGNNDSAILSATNLNYRINFIKNGVNNNSLLDTKYSCNEGSCPNYPVSLSDIKIGQNDFKLSQSDTTYDTKDGTKSKMAIRTVKMVGSVDGWTVYTVQSEIPYQLGKEIPVDKDFGQLVLHEIINSIKPLK